jgi:NitT/TauT family transport system permease protein
MHLLLQVLHRPLTRDPENAAVSSNLVEPEALDAEPEHPRPAPGAGRARRLRPGAALAPALMALVALAVHHLIANRQLLPMSWMDKLPVWSHPYSVLLLGLLAVSLLAAVAQWGWPSLRPLVRHHGPLLAGALGLLCLWELVTAKLAWMPQPYFPGPDEVLGALVEDRVVLFKSAWSSLLLLLCGYTFGVAAGIVTGVFIGWFPNVRFWSMPVLKVLGPIPATALIPLAMMLPVKEHLFLSRAALIGFAVWFPVTMLTSSGISNVRLSYLDVARTLGAGRLYLIFRVAIPSALPNIFFGLFMGLGASFLTLVVAEGIGADAGLGWYLQWQKGYADFAKVYASLVIMAFFFSSLMTLLFKLRDRVLKWQKGVIKW